MEIKVCIECKDEKSIDEFNKDKLKKDGLCPYCKKCQSKKNKKWRKENPQKTKDYSKKFREQNKGVIKIRNIKYCKENAEKVKTRRKQWRAKNLETIKAKSKKYYYENYEKNKENRKEYMRTYKREKGENDPVFRLNNNMRNAIWRSLKGGKNKKQWESLVKYDFSELKKYIESLFQENMTWDNYGKWHLDHRIPISLFNITSAKCKGFKKCWALENLRPMWAIDNLKKSDKLFT